MFERGTMLFLYAETPSHVGAGESATVDLAIQRNATTGWPTIQASSLKGALRSAAPGGNDVEAWKLTAMFGFDKHDSRTKNVAGMQAAEHASGALSVGDAAVLAFPVTSLAGVFAWATCRQALRDFQRSWDLLPDRSTPPFELAWLPTSLPDGQAVCCDGPHGTANVLLPVQGGGQQAPSQLVLQDAVLSRLGDAGATHGLTTFADWLATNALAGQPDIVSNKLRQDLVLVSDNTFSSLVDAGVHVITRVKIDDDTGTAARSGPWDEELLPAETILCAPLLAGPSRIRHVTQPAGAELPDTQSVMDHFTTAVVQAGDRSRRFQIGAGSTVGWGWMAPAAV